MLKKAWAEPGQNQEPITQSYAVAGTQLLELSLSVSKGVHEQEGVLGCGAGT